MENSFAYRRVFRRKIPRTTARDKLKPLKCLPENRPNMSQATKVVLGTVGISIVVGLLLLVAIVAV
jgi:hypothetical protein